MDNYFGLGFVLNVEDKASSAFGVVDASMQNLMNTSQQTFMSMNMAGMALNQLGEGAMSAGQKVLSGFANAGKAVVSTGDDFEKTMITLSALYGTAEEAKKKMDWAMDFSARSPFEITDIKSALVGFKTAGVDATETITAVGGSTKEFMSYVGDLAALRPDKSISDIVAGVRNALGGDGGKSLRARLDMNPTQILGRKLGDTSKQIMQDIADMAQKTAPDLMTKLNGTFSQMVSNLNDQKTRLLKGIADGGAFNMVKGSLQKIYDTVGSISQERLEGIGRSLADCFAMVFKPLDLIVDGLIKVFNWMVWLEETYPTVGKFVVGFTALAGILLVGTGLFFKFAGGILMSLGGLGMLVVTLAKFGGIANIFSLITTSLGGLVVSVLPAIAVVGLLFLAWKNNFIGIRDMSITFVNNTRLAFSEASRIANLSSQDMADAVNKLDTHTFFGGLTLAIIKLEVLWMALVDAWNDGGLSEENFQKAKTLGLLPLISTILDLKWTLEKMWESFKAGFSDTLSVVAKVGSSMFSIFKNIASALEPVVNGFLKLIGVTHNMSTKPVEALGYALGVVAGLIVTSKVVSVIMAIGSALGGVMSIGVNFVGMLARVFIAPLAPLGRLLTAIRAFGGLTPFLIAQFSIWGVKLSTIFTGMISSVTGSIAGIAAVLLDPLTWIVAGIVAVGVALVYCMNHWDTIKQVASNTMDVINMKISDFVESSKNKLYELYNGAIIWIKDLPNKISKKLEEVKLGIQQWISDTKQVIIQKLEDWTIAFTNWVKNLPTTIKNGLNILGKAIINWTIQQNSENKRQFGLWGKAILDIIIKMKDNVVNKFKDITKGMSNEITKLKTEIPKKFDDIKNGILNKITEWKNGIKTKLNDIRNSFPSSINEWKVAIVTKFDEIKTGILSKILNWKESIKTSLKGMTDSFKDTGKNIFQNLLEGMTSDEPTMTDKLGSMLLRAIGGVIIVVGVAAIALGREIIKQILSGLAEGYEKIKQAFKDAFQKGLDGVKEKVIEIKSYLAGLSFNLPEIKFPKIKTPHFNVQGELSLSPPSVPSIGVEWYAKGGIFNSPSVIGVGEAGTEAVLPINKLSEIILETIGKLPKIPDKTSLTSNALNSILGEIQYNNVPKNTITKAPLNLEANNTPTPLNLVTQVTSKIQNLGGNIPTHVTPTIQQVASASIRNNERKQNANTGEVRQDNSVTFQNGAIQITMTNGNETDVNRLVKIIGNKLQKQNQLNKMRNYQPI